MADNADDEDGEKTPQGTARLFEMDTREVSLVDHPANKRRLLVVKRADGTDEQIDLGAEDVEKVWSDEAREAAEAARAAHAGGKPDEMKGHIDRLAGARDKMREGGKDRHRAGQELSQLRQGHQDLAAGDKKPLGPSAAPQKKSSDGIADQLTVEAPTTKALDQIKKELAGNASEETAKMSQPTTTPAPGAAPTTKAETPAAPAPVSKIGRPMNGDRLDRLKAAHKIVKEAVAELRGGQVSFEKFDRAASDLASIISECDVVKLLDAVRAEKTAKMAAGPSGFATGSTLPSDPNMGAGVQPDPAEVAGADAVFGEGVPAGVALLVKGMQGRLDAIEKRNATLEKKNANLQTEVVSLKKFREAPTALEEGEAEEILSGGEEDPVDDGNDPWASDMAEELAAERELAAEASED